MTDAPFTETHRETTTRMRKASVAVYLAAEESVADDLSSLLRAGADAIDAALAEIDRLRERIAAYERLDVYKLITRPETP